MIPTAVTIGFSGPRKWGDATGSPEGAEQVVDQEVAAWIIRRMRLIPGELNLPSYLFFCGISQIAIRADMAFTRACKSLNLPQRILLPQHRDAYFDAREPDGSPDFTALDKIEALELLKSPHIVEDRLASSAPDRQLRFEETNAELVRQSDLLMCLVLEGTGMRAGGTQDVIAKAETAGKPILRVTIQVADGRPIFQEGWIGDPGLVGKRIETSPANHDIFGLDIPDTGPHADFPCEDRCLRVVMEHSEELACRHSRFFRSAAVIIVGTHGLATFCATAAMKVHAKAILLTFLGVETALLVTGYLVHHRLHHHAAASRWALHRLVSEICRSVIALKGCHVDWSYLHSLPIPEILRPFIRTMEILHLRASRKAVSQDWKKLRDDYISGRVDGQITFYKRQGERARKRLSQAHTVFVWSSRFAILATVTKVAEVLARLSFGGIPSDSWIAILGFLAVVLPVLAVGVLSLAAANDLEARSHSFDEMFQFLTQQRRRLMQGVSRSDLNLFMIETESRLVGETVNWFSRRSFTGVA